MVNCVSMEDNSCFNTVLIIAEPGIHRKNPKEITRKYSHIIPIQFSPVKILPTSKRYFQSIVHALNYLFLNVSFLRIFLLYLLFLLFLLPFLLQFNYGPISDLCRPILAQNTLFSFRITYDQCLFGILFCSLSPYSFMFTQKCLATGRILQHIH